MFLTRLLKRHYLTANAYAELSFLKNFTFRTSLGGRYGQDETRTYNPVYTATLAQRNTNSLLTFVRPQARYWIFENTLTYTKEIGKHSFTALLGQSAQHDQSYQLNCYGT